MASIKTLPIHQRPREKLLAQGAENLTDKELLAILIRTGRLGYSALEIAAETLYKFPLKKLCNQTFADLRQIKGLDQGKICSLLAAFELAKRALNQLETALSVIESPEQVIAQIHEIRNLKREHFVVLYLNARNQLLHKETVSIGTLTASLVHPREVFAPALEIRAANVVLTHNHPSGNELPSEDDVELTERLVSAGEILGITVLDHIILSATSYASLKELDLL